MYDLNSDMTVTCNIVTFSARLMNRFTKFLSLWLKQAWLKQTVQIVVFMILIQTRM